MSDTAAPAGGLYAALKGSSATLLAMARTRLELLGLELQEEKARTLRLLLLGLAAAFCAGIGLVLAVVLIAVLFWESRVAVFAAGCALFLAAAFVCWNAFSRVLARPRPVFEHTLAELSADVEALKASLKSPGDAAPAAAPADPPR